MAGSNGMLFYRIAWREGSELGISNKIISIIFRKEVMELISG